MWYDDRQTRALSPLSLPLNVLQRGRREENKLAREHHVICPLLGPRAKTMQDVDLQLSSVSSDSWETNRYWPVELIVIDGSSSHSRATRCPHSRLVSPTQRIFQTGTNKEILVGKYFYTYRQYKLITRLLPLCDPYVNQAVGSMYATFFYLHVRARLRTHPLCSLPPPSLCVKQLTNKCLRQIDTPDELSSKQVDRRRSRSD